MNFKEKLLSFFYGIIMVIVILVLWTAIIGCLLAFPVMLLWNWLVPDIFGLPEISFWQAFGLYFLFSFLFKNNNSKGKSNA